MINFKFADAYAALTLVNMKARATLEASLASRLPHGAVQSIDDDTRAEVRSIIFHCRESFGPLGVPAIQDRLDRFSGLLEGSRPVDWELLHSDLRVLREVLQDEMQRQYFYRYPANMATLVLRFDDDWKEVLAKFPSARSDAFDATDCAALGKGTAAVFHLMRTLEHGLRALAKDVGKSFDVQNWQNIIEQIEAEIRNLGKTLPSGQPKNERIQFLSEAAKEFVFFKDGWRNYVSHGKSSYDTLQARSALDHVKAFMTILSSRLAE